MERTLTMLAVAAALGVAADLSISLAPERLDVAIWLLVSLGAGLAMAAGGVVELPPASRWLGGAAALFAAGIVGRDAPALAVLNLGAALICVWLAAPVTAPARAAARQLGEYARLVVMSGLATALGPAPALSGDVDWSGVRPGARLRPASGVGIGLLIAAPVLLLFGNLFSDADPLFHRAISTVFDVDLGPLAVHAVRIAVVAWLVAGFLRWAFAPPASPRPGPNGSLAGFTVIGTALGAVAALFVLFILVQARTLFGGDAFVRAAVGLSYSEYARQGFFQLMWVAILSLPLLLAADWALDQADTVSRRRFRLLASLLLACLTVIVASALFRMSVYTSAYGLTEQRLYASAFMVWLAAVFGWFGATVLRGRRERFTGGAVLGGLACLLVLNAANPDAVIARVDLDRSGSAAPFDPLYVATLSADALPVVLARLPALPAADRCALAKGLRSAWNRRTERPVWNLSRAAAASAIAHAQTLQVEGCTSPDAT